MKRTEIFKQLDTAIGKRNPVLAEHLRHGLTKQEILKRLQNVCGSTELLVDLYSWHDGTESISNQNEDVCNFSLMEMSLIPDEIFIFSELDIMLSHFYYFGEAAKYDSRLKIAAEKFFPFLWDGCRNCFALDTQSERVVFLDFESEEPFREAYPSFNEFLFDLLSANEKSETINFFET